MAKKLVIKGTKIEENQYYKVIKPEDDKNKVYVVSKYDDTIYECDSYKIIGAAVLQELQGSKFYSNYVNIQKYGQGKVTCNRMEIDSWTTKNNQTAIKYFNEKGFKFVRFIDEEGNLYKKQPKKAKEETISL